MVLELQTHKIAGDAPRTVSGGPISRCWNPPRPPPRPEYLLRKICIISENADVPPPRPPNPPPPLPPLLIFQKVLIAREMAAKSMSRARTSGRSCASWTVVCRTGSEEARRARKHEGGRRSSRRGACGVVKKLSARALVLCPSPHTPHAWPPSSSTAHPLPSSPRLPSTTTTIACAYPRMFGARCYSPTMRSRRSRSRAPVIKPELPGHCPL